MDIITQRLKLFDIDPEKAKGYADIMGCKAEDVEYIKKGLIAADVQFDEGEHAAVSYITTRDIDRDGEIVEPAGADLEAYRKNPVVLFGHNYYELPIGKNLWIKSDERGLIAKTQYANHDFAQTVYNYRKDGFPLAQSIGFVPLEWEDNPVDVKGCRRRYRKWALLEYSDVPVPANPEAVGIAVSKGLIKSAPTEKIIYNGQPSVFDIFNAIDFTINKERQRESDPWYWVSDLYPVTYPNGNAIIGKGGDGQSHYFVAPYTFSDGVATVGDMSPMQIEYVAKIYNQLEKDGRALSSRNRTMIMAAVQQMDEAAAALRELLEATNPEPAAEPAGEMVEMAAEAAPVEKQEPAPVEKAIGKQDLANVLKEALAANRVNIAGLVDEAVARKMGRVSL